jgi:hypothetical protein
MTQEDKDTKDMNIDYCVREQKNGFRFHSLLLNFLDIFLLTDTVIYVHVLCVFIFLKNIQKIQQ